MGTVKLMFFRRGLLSRRIKIASIAAVILAVFIIAASGGTFAGRVEPVEEKIAGLSQRIGIDVKPSRKSAVDYARLDQRLQRLVEQDHLVGLAVGIVEDGRIQIGRAPGRERGCP